MGKIIKIITLMMVVATLVIAGIFLIQKKKEEISKIPTPEKPYYTIRGTRLEEGTVLLTRDFVGEFRPENVVLVSSNKSGYIKKIYVKTGQEVKKGQILSVIDDTQIKNQIKNLQIDLKNLELRLKSLKTREQAVKALLITKENIYKRDKRLFEKKAVSKEKVEKSYSSYLLAKSQLEDIQTEMQTTKNRIKQLSNELKTQKNSLLYLRIKSPVDGVIQNISLREGNLVLPGKPIMRIEESKRYEIVIKVPSDYPVKEGDPVRIRFNGNVKDYKVSTVYPSPSDYLKVVKIRLTEKPEGIISNSLINVSFVKEIEGFVVPKNAVLNTSSGSYVLTVSEGRFKKIPVVVKGMNKKFAVVSGDLKKGMIIAVAEENKLRLLSTGKKGKIVLEKEE
ncbi:efflux RND transporter periplasmic adaptor subunit [Persephonella sp.]|uniref:efflux RND transporter periplasmic adaptor subunit n=1 Tax=Persephonella sp. TaxID=2060922 RepID=UPI0025E0FDF4|nr:efflux RND transporter periplasmic adaptor subunit [Persephonella sp.]